MKYVRKVKRSVLILVLLLFSTVIFLPFSLRAEDSGKTVRVGWYESPFNSTDEYGRRSGYAYDYQLKISAYSGWDYTYVDGSWTDLVQMLKDGDIDLLSDVSYTEERAKDMLFSELPMGTEEYIIFISPDNTEINSEDLSTLNGKKIGVNKGSIQEGFYQEWAGENNVTADLVELTTNEDETLKLLDSGGLDAYITLNAYGDPRRLVPVCKIGSSDFFFAVNKNRPDILEELNDAMSRIWDENPYYNQRMFEKYVQRFGTNASLTPEEKSWLSSHGPIRVGYQDNYLAFCAKDKRTGELKGALKDYLEEASDCLANSHIAFTEKAYPTAESALEALKRDEIDCVFPANLSSYDGEEMHIIMTPSIMRTDVYAVVRKTDQDIFAKKDYVIVAVNEGNTNYDAFLIDNFPSWHKVYFADTAECLKAVSEGVADCVLISNYRYNNISRLCEKYHLTTFATGKVLDYSLAVSEGETELYSILAKTAGLVPTPTIDAALSYYMSEDARLSFRDLVIDNLAVILTVITVMVLIIIIILIRSMKMELRARQLIKATESDDLTGLYNRDYFFQYAERIYQEHPDVPYDAIVLNIEQFHSINALNGWEFGDEVLTTLGREILAIAKDNNGIAGRFGADRFDIYCRETNDYKAIFDRLQDKLDDLSSNASIRIRMGVMPWQGGLEPIQLFDRARTACSMAKGNYNEHLIVFDEKMRKRELLDQRLLNDLRHALDNYQFEVFYQPKYNIQTDPPKLVSAEALIRWQHPQLGLIPPDSFIPLFERNGKVQEVDKYVWDQAARQIARWRAQFGITIPVSINLSRVDVFDPTLECTLDNILMKNGLDPDKLKLEVTESAYTENADQLIRVVADLHTKGYTIEMDDFGTGYSSLSMFSSMPIDVIKMDRTFVKNIEHNEKDTHLVALILGLAKNMGITVVAEGVETESQMLLLKKLGCELVQGYYFSKPLHPSDFEKLIIRERDSCDP